MRNECPRCGGSKRPITRPVGAVTPRPLPRRPGRGSRPASRAAASGDQCRPSGRSGTTGWRRQPAAQVDDGGSPRVPRHHLGQRRAVGVVASRVEQRHGRERRQHPQHAGDAGRLEGGRRRVVVGDQALGEAGVGEGERTLASSQTRSSMSRTVTMPTTTSGCRLPSGSGQSFARAGRRTPAEAVRSSSTSLMSRRG